MKKNKLCRLAYSEDLLLRLKDISFEIVPAVDSGVFEVSVTFMGMASTLEKVEIVFQVCCLFECLL